MIHLSITIGLSVLGGLLILIGLLYTKEQQIIKIISFVFGILMLLLLAGHIMTGQQECEIVLTGFEDDYVYGNNFTDYHWDYSDPNPYVFDTDAFIFHVERNNTYERLCFDTGSSIPIKTFQYFDRFVYIFRIVMWIMIGYIILSYTGVIQKLQEKFQNKST